jgi:hypothetical protein
MDVDGIINVQISQLVALVDAFHAQVVTGIYAAMAISKLFEM